MRRALLPAVAATLAGSVLSGCSGGLAGLIGGGEAGPAAVASVPGSAIGRGSVKIGLILPLSAQGQAGAAATALRNAAELAYTEFNNPDIEILVKDDRGTPEGARAATQAAINEGAELILGPLFANAVQGAAQVAKSAGKPMIAFSTDTTVASRGVYLLSFLPETEVTRVVGYAAQQGRKSFAALIPDNAYGKVAEAAFRTQVARVGGQIASIETFPLDAARLREPAQRIAALAAGPNPRVDALFIPDGGDSLAAVAQVLQASGIGKGRVKLLGTGLWNDAHLFALPALQGGWFAAPDSAGYNAFAQRYRAKFGTDPTRIATLGYDSVSLAAALVRTQGSQRFSESVLTNPSGFAGADGVFRLLPTGANERGLAVLEVRNGTAVTVNPAPVQLKPEI